MTAAEGGWLRYACCVERRSAGGCASHTHNCTYVLHKLTVPARESDVTMRRCVLESRYILATFIKRMYRELLAQSLFAEIEGE
jgi:hypothetical protein